MRKFRFPLVAIIPICLFISAARGQASKVAKKENVVYGIVSNLALLMDVYQPEKSNKKGVIFIHGSGWGFGYPDNYGQSDLKSDYYADTAYSARWAQELVQRGYTLFVINHRFTPRFRFRDIFADCQRAVRFIRFHAKEYGIDPDHIGAMGHSSGANLSALLGVTEDNGALSGTAIDSVSAKIQAVVAMAAPFNLADINKNEDSAMNRNYMISVVNAYMGGLPPLDWSEFLLSGEYAAASPLAQVTKGDAPMLIYYSDDDPVIPVRQAVEMNKKLTDNNVMSKIIRRSKESHFPVPDMREVDSWFKEHLR